MKTKKFFFAGRKGFTFIELLVSIAIILVLSSIAVISYQSSSRGARDNKRKADLEQIRAALEMYRSDSATGVYPADKNDLVGDYLSELPADPKGYTYYYNRLTDYTYTLSAFMEGGSYTGDYGDHCDAPDSSPCNYQLTNP